MSGGWIRVLWLAGLLGVSCVPRVNVPPQAHESLGSVLWMQTAPECRAAAVQAFRAARERLAPALEDETWTAALEQTGDCSRLPPAVVLDVDETVLDNTLYLGEIVRQGTVHGPQGWDAWVRQRRAPAVPGAVGFVQAASERGVTPVYISNRRCERRPGEDSPCPQKQDTVDNLHRAGFPAVRPEQVLLRGERREWGADKGTRRAYVAQRYRILLLVGDNVGDFLSLHGRGAAPDERAVRVQEHDERWGEKWFVLPNPVYGSWRRALKEPVSLSVRGILSTEDPDPGQTSR